MCSTMVHRGPDEEGIVFVHASKRNDALKVALAHRRLSIIDLQTGRQPIHNEDETIWIICNGEIYNFLDLRQDLINEGHKFYTNSDTEVLVHCYEKYGENFVSYIRGGFALGIWDSQKNKLILARDRFGKKPLLYVNKNGHLIFASEFEALLVHSLVSKDIYYEGIYHFLSYGYIPAPFSVYKDIKKLLPGEILVFDGIRKELKTNFYWKLNYREKLKLSEKEAIFKLRQQVDEAVKIRMISDVPLGAFLSGGIDSSIVVSIMSKFSTSRIKTFSIGFEEQEYNELNFARSVAEKYNTEHREFIVKPDIIKILPKLVRHYGEPYSDSSAIPTFYLAKVTKDFVKVALNGDGGDELFAGYERHLANTLAKSYQRLPLWLRDGFINPLAKNLPDSLNPKNRIRKFKRFLLGASLPREVRFLKWVGIFSGELKDKILSREFRNEMKEVDSLNVMRRVFAETIGLEITDATLYVDTYLNLPNDLTIKMDIATMANSLEARSPFLDQELAQFAACLPASLKIKKGIFKYILRKAFWSELPENVRNRGKMGFALPLGKWLRTSLRDYLKGSLLSGKSLQRGYFEPSIIKTIVTEHVDGRRDWTPQLWNLLMLEKWHQEFIDN